VLIVRFRIAAASLHQSTVHLHASLSYAVFVSVYGQKRPLRKVCATGENRISMSRIVEGGTPSLSFEVLSRKTFTRSTQMGSQDRGTRRGEVSEVALDSCAHFFASEARVALL
jgi:hypothetical protein